MGNICAKGSDSRSDRPRTQEPSNHRPQHKPGAPAGGTHGSKARQQHLQQPPVPEFGLQSTHEIVRILGRGGEGETWLFRDKQSGELAAIKLIKRPIPRPAIAVINREIKIQADLGQGHLNIVSADEVVLTRSHLGLVMEYVPGRLLPQPVDGFRLPL